LGGRSLHTTRSIAQMFLRVASKVVSGGSMTSAVDLKACELDYL